MSNARPRADVPGNGPDGRREGEGTPEVRPGCPKPVTKDTERMIKLAELRDRVGSGLYEVDALLVADALLRRLGESLALPSLDPDFQLRCS